MATQKHNDPVGGIPITPANQSQQAMAPVPDEKLAVPLSSRQDNLENPPPPKRHGRFILFGAAILFAMGLGIYLLIPYLLTNSLPQYLSNRLQRSVTIGDADFSLAPLTLTLRHGIIGPREDLSDDHIDPLLSFSELSLTLDPKALLQGTVSLRKLTIVHPFYHLVLHKDGSSNLAAMLARFTSQQQIPSIGGLFPRLLEFCTGADINISGGKILIGDEMTGRHHQIDNIVVQLPSGTAATPGQDRHLLAGGQPPKISAVINGYPVSLAARQTTTPDGKALALRLQINDTDLLPYAPYIPATYGYRLLAGRGSVQLDYLLPGQQKAAGSAEIAATLKLTGLRLQDGASTEISIGVLELSGRYLSASRQLVITNLSIGEPSFSVTHQQNGTWTFPGKKLLSESAPPKSAKRNWQVKDLSIRHGTVLFTDLSVKGGFTETFKDLALSLHGLHPEDRQTPAVFSMQAKSRQKSAFTMEGKLSFFPFSCSGMLLVDNLPLPPLAPYLENTLAPATLKDGELEKASLPFSCSSHQNGMSSVTLNKANLLISDLILESAQEGSFHLAAAKISDIRLDSLAKRLEVGQIAVPDWKVTLPGNDLLTLSNSLAPSANQQGRAGLTSWRTVIHQAILQRATVLTGNTPPNSRHITFGKTEIFNLANIPDQTGKVTGSLSFASGGSLQFFGALLPAPFRTELQVTLDGLPLQHFPEFWANWLNPPVQTGVLQAKGTLRLPELSFTGSFGISDFKAGTLAPVIAWNQLLAQSCSLTGRPFSLAMQNVTLDQPYFNWLIFGQHRSNLKQLIKKSDKKNSTPDYMVKIADITIHDGSLDFADHALTPPYLTHYGRINGSMDVLSNAPGSHSHLSVNGMLPGEASLSLEGDFDFFSPQLYADFTANVNDLDLRSLSPYTEPILGYTLSSGLLNMRTTFRQENGVITADNKLKLKGVKLGRQLQNLSQLPLTLALLTDPDGIIELSIPVHGETADPSFSFHNSFFGTIRNLVLRTAVSPFSVFNAFIPQKKGLDLDHVAFAFGEAKISKKVENQLAEIAKAIRLRPWLAISIQGEADGKTDLETLMVQQKQQNAARQLQQERQLSNRLSRKYGNEVIDLGELKSAKQEQSETAKLPPPGQEDLVALARQRGQAVYQALQKKGVPKRQLHLINKPLIVGADAQNRDGNRVSLSLEPILSL